MVLVPFGYLVIKESGQTFKANILDGNISLSETLKDLKLSDLDLTDLQHNISYDGVISSWANTEGYIHALADYFGVDSANVFLSDLMPGAIFVKTLWDKIFTESGLTYSGDIFTKQEFLDLVVATTKGSTARVTIGAATVLGSFNGSPLGGSFQIDIYGVGYEEYFTFSGSGTDIINNTSDLEFDFDGLAEIDIDSIISVSGGVYNEGTIFIEINGDVRGYVDKDDPDQSFIFRVHDGDKLKLRFFAYGYTDSGTEDFFYNVSCSVDISSRAESGDSLSYFLDDTKQIDFLKDIMQRFGLLFRRTSETNFEFKQIETLFGEKAQAEDWSDKYISHTEKYSIGDYSQNNFFRYKYDEEGDDFSDGNMEVSNQNLKETKDLFTSIFTASKPKGSIGGKSYLNIPLYELSEGSYEEKEDKLRIFNIVRHSLTVKMKIEAATFYTEEAESVAFMAHADYQTHVDNNYSALKTALDNSLKIKAQMWLTDIDIYNLDFFTLKYIKQLGAYFYLNKVSNYVRGQVTEVELIKV
jgi:hypothetical protein